MDLLVFGAIMQSLQAEYGNNRLVLRIKVILYLVVQETLWDLLEMKETE